MFHDFIDPYSSPKTVRRDSAGNSCTDVGGVMDYVDTATKWTTCSVEAFTQHYNDVISRTGSFCLKLNTETVPGANPPKITEPPKSTHVQSHGF
jgi:hypothetical protein